MTETVVTDEFMLEMRAKAKAFTLVLISQGPRWDAPDRAAIIWEHGRRNHALRLEKVLAIVGPVPDESPLVGLYIFDRTPAEAEQIMRGDPAVQAGVFVFDVHPLMAFPGDSLPDRPVQSPPVAHDDNGDPATMSVSGEPDPKRE